MLNVITEKKKKLNRTVGHTSPREFKREFKSDIYNNKIIKNHGHVDVNVN